MSILSKASLVQIPSGYGEDKLYSEVPNTAAGDFTFTRASTGTRVNSDGYIEEVPWNLVTNSNDLSYLSTSNVIKTTNATTSPIGSNDAISVVNTNNYANLFKTNVTIKKDSNFTQSVYVKPFSTSFIYMRALLFDNDMFCWFDLENISVGTDAYNIGSIEQAEDGWVRCSITFTSTTNLTGRLYLYATSADNQIAQTGDSVYYWGLQYNHGSPKPYIKTTDRLNIPRLDYSGGASCPTLLLEPQRTNLVEYADFTNSYWTKTRSTIVESGTMLGQTSYNFVSNVGLSGRVSRGNFPQDGQEYHKSVYVKYNGVRYVYFGNGNPSNSFEVIVFDFTTESITYEGSRIGRSSVTDMGNGIFRIVWTTPNSNSTAKNRFTIGFSSSATTFNDYVGDGVQGVLITSPQYEQGSFPTSYIPTSGTSVTRTLESGIITSATDLIGQTQGTLYSEFDLTEDNNFTFLEINLGNSTSNRILAYRNGSYIQFIVQVGGTVEINNPTLVTFLDTNKIAITYQTDDFKIYLNGSLVKTYTSGNIPSGFDTIDLQDNNLNGKKQRIKSLAIFKEILTSTELETLTTI